MILQDLYLLQVVFLAHLVQLLLTYEEPQTESEMDVDVSDEAVESTSDGDCAWLVSMLTHCRSVAGLHPITINPQHLLDYVKETWYVSGYALILSAYVSLYNQFPII